jgi:hypothetical protein
MEGSILLEGAFKMNKTKLSILALVLGFTLVASAFVLAGAQGVQNPAAGIRAIVPYGGASITPVEDTEDGDGISNDVEQINQRTVTVEQSGNEFQIESTLRNGEVKDQIELQIRPDGEGLGVQLQYKSEAAGSEMELSFEVQFRALVEYVDSNANGVYDSGIDTLVQTKSLNSFDTATYSLLVIDGANVSYIHVQTTDGVFGIHAYIPDEFTMVNGSLVTPTQVKIDIEINGFPYINGSSDLALYMKLSSESDYSVSSETEDERSGFSSGEEEVKTTAGGSHTGVFSWVTTADIDGITKDVLTSNIATDDGEASEQKMYLCYPRGNHIYHDPKVGVAGIIQSPANWTWAFVLAGVAAVAFVIGVVIAKKRR